jgi:carbamoyltransferase
MGLAAHGRPSYLDTMRSLMRPAPDGRFETDLDCFLHASEGVTMSWDEGEPHIGRLWSPTLAERLGLPRVPDAPLEDRHRDLAASLQVAYEEVFFHRLRWLQQKTGLTDLCLAGGCAQNSVANGKIFTQTGFKRVFVQPAAGDAGTALGAAQYVWHERQGQPRGFVLTHSCWGPAFGEPRIVAALAARLPGFDPRRPRAGDLHVKRAPDERELLGTTARALAEGQIVGWFQGRSEWGPRALGNRSILADPRCATLRDVLNARIKRRESFRPFAPSILAERVGDYFMETQPDPFMTMVYPIRPERRGEIPAVTHVDGTGRLQTVSRDRQPRYWALIKAFEERTGVPVLVNTSFNESEPIVNAPEEALDCFLRTGMDRLVLGEWTIARAEDPPA